MGIKQDVIAAPISKMVKDCLADTGMDNNSMLKCRKMCIRDRKNARCNLH